LSRIKSRIRKIKWSNQPVSFLKIVPNLLTISGLCIGFSAIRFAMDQKWEIAALCVVIASLIDGIDGKVARLLNASSTFGAELDSLCDFVNFGITPVIITYLWIFNDYSIKVFSWSVVLFFTICTSIRLARFNTMAISANEDRIFSNYFIGIPAPAGALLALLPLINEFEIKEYTSFSFHSHPFIIGIYQCIIGVLMASRIPTISLKKVTINPKYISLILGLSGAFVISMILLTWIVIPILAIIYIFSIPFSYYSAKKLISNDIKT
jgi:CDP-diacylglycerol--serine O-phosphatidyltransferase